MLGNQNEAQTNPHQVSVLQSPCESTKGCPELQRGCGLSTDTQAPGAHGLRGHACMCFTCGHQEKNKAPAKMPALIPHQDLLSSVTVNLLIQVQSTLSTRDRKNQFLPHFHQLQANPVCEHGPFPPASQASLLCRLTPTCPRRCVG